MKKLLSLVALLFVFIMATSCTEDTADIKQAEATEESLARANEECGMPAIVNWQERKQMKRILELRDQEDLICYAYTFSEMTGKFTFIGRCDGFGLPYCTQYTSPEAYTTVVDRRGMDTKTSKVMPQADPNGLFMPQTSSATWLMMIDDDGEARPCYFEPKIAVFPFKFH